jgi:MtN3 and saliva related transmembrane protein
MSKAHRSGIAHADKARLLYNRGSPRFPAIIHVNTEHLGFAAAALTTFSFVPQVLLVWRTREAAGVSTGMYLTFIAGVALWLWYGLQIGSMPVVLANTLTLALASSILVMKWRFGGLSLRDCPPPFAESGKTSKAGDSPGGTVP